ncbi:MAG: carboxypeptidase-like regulatory domain-containing protein, partial [Flavobacterium sp.]
RDDDFWEENRFENLNKDEKGIYKMLDTLQTNKKFRQLYDIVSILGSGYIQKGNFDIGPIFSTFGFNEVEGIRMRVGGRTYFGPNDMWRLQGYTAYGFKDNKFKYGLSGKWLLNRKNRLTLSGGNRRDVEQIGASLTTTNDVLGRSFASSALFTSGNNGKLTNINLSSVALEIEPVKNLTLQIGGSFRTLESASQTFSLAYYTDLTRQKIKNDITQTELNLQIDYTPGRKTVGYGVERSIVDNPYPRIFVNYSQGLKGVMNSDFDYEKIQLYYKQPMNIGGLGRLDAIVELGKTYSYIPLGLMSIVPGNQTYFSIENTFNLLDFYEFAADSYATIQ